MAILEKIYAYGHENILCTHNTTIEITKDKCITKQGNCIIGINASKACYDLSKNLKKIIKNGKKIKIIIKADKFSDSFYGYGNMNLTLLNKKDMVFRKSDFICDRTVLINCTKSSIEINRELVQKLKDFKKKISIAFEINDVKQK